MDSDITLHIAAAEHADAISLVIRDALRRINAKDYPPSEIDRLMIGFSSNKVLQLMRTRLTLAAMSDGLVVGTGALQGTEVKSVFVSPDWHGQGVGTALVTALEAHASRLGYKALDVSSSLSATGFYEALGYVETRRNFFGPEETVMMSKAL